MAALLQRAVAICMESSPEPVARHAAIDDRAAGIARARQLAVHVVASAVGPTLHPVDHEVSQEPPVGESVVPPNIEDMHVTLAAGTGVARPLAGAEDVQLLVVR